MAISFLRESTQECVFQPREGLAECHLCNAYLEKKSKDPQWNFLHPQAACHESVLRLAKAAKVDIESPFTPDPTCSTTMTKQPAKGKAPTTQVILDTTKKNCSFFFEG